MNGFNTIGVHFSQIAFFEKLLKGHDNVLSYARSQDVIFHIERDVGPAISLLVCNEYTCSLTRVMEFIGDFGKVDIIYVGGNWNGYTLEAKLHCMENKIGLYNSTEIFKALHMSKHWNYYTKDKKGRKWCLNWQLRLD